MAVLELLLFGTWTFWVAISIGFILLFATVEEYIKTDNSLRGQMGRPITILLVIISLCIWANNPREIWLYTQENWLRELIYVLVYLVLGSLWSFNRWRMATNAAVERYRDYLLEFIELNGEIRNKKTVLDFKPKLEEWKVSIISWILFWPVSMLRYVFGSFLIDIFEGIFNSLKGVYQRMMDRRFAKVADLEARTAMIIEQKKVKEETLRNGTMKDVDS